MMYLLGALKEDVHVHADLINLHMHSLLHISFSSYGTLIPY